MRYPEIFYSADFAVFECAVWNHWRVLKTNYWAHAMRRKHYRAICISLNCVLSNANRTKQNANVAEGEMFQWTKHAYCTVLYWGTASSPAWLCSVTCYFILFYFVSHSWFFFKVKSFQLCACECLCVGPRNEAHCHSIKWPNAKGSEVSHHSLFSLVCLVSSSLQWLWSLLSLSAHTWLEIMMGAGGLLGCRNVTCIVGLLLDML